MGISNEFGHAYDSYKYHSIMTAKKKQFKVGRDAETGRFISIEEAERRKKTSVVETLKKKRKRRMGGDN